MNQIHDQRRLNLFKQVEMSGLKRADWCRKYDISPSYLSQLLNNSCRFGEKAARSLEDKIGLSEDALDQNSESRLSIIEVWETTDHLPDRSFALVPQLPINSKFNGDALVQGNELLPSLAFRGDWLKKRNVTSRAKLRTCTMRGDAMEPHLQNDDTVLIDIGQTIVQDNQIYVIRYGNDVRINRLSKRFDGGLLIRSDNPHYPDEILTASEAATLQILGKMLWRGG
jgi:hypothetical protein